MGATTTSSFLTGVTGASGTFSGDLTGVAGLGASMLDSSFSDVEVMVSLVSSSSAEPWACDWWYLRPLICLYFLLQLGSGHSSRTGEAGGLPEAATGGVGAAATLVFLPVAGGAGSSSPALDLRLLEGSGRGGMKGVGDEVPVLLALFAGVLPVAPRRPLPPPLRSLL